MTSRSFLRLSLLLTAATLVCQVGCRPKDGSGGASVTIQNKGSDTMVNVAQVWAEDYRKAHPAVSVEVSGGGSGVGIAALIKGTVDIASSSRDMKPGEIEQAKKSTGREPVGFVVGHDALVIYVHKNNPLDEISIEQLAAVFAEGGSITRWSQLGVSLPGGQDEIIRVSRQSSSGTYEFFREHVLAKHDFKLGSRDMNGSKEVVELIGTTLGAIGYSGMGYHDPAHVKMLRVASRPGEPAVEPTLATAMSGAYPIARSLLLYTLGQPEGEVKAYIDWIRGPEGQRIVQASGYVPLGPDERAP